MMTLQSTMGTARSTYPGEYTPDPSTFERLKSHEPFNAASGIFSHVNTSEDKEYYKIELQTQGLTRKDLLVRINERGNLFIAGIHKNESAFSMVGLEINPLDYSGFSRELSLPENIDTDFIKAQFKLGVLSIWFLKTTEPYPKRSSVVVVY